MRMRCSGAVLRLSNYPTELAEKDRDLDVSNEVCFSRCANLHEAIKFGAARLLHAAVVV